MKHKTKVAAIKKELALEKSCAQFFKNILYIAPFVFCATAYADEEIKRVCFQNDTGADLQITDVKVTGQTVKGTRVTAPITSAELVKSNPNVVPKNTGSNWGDYCYTFNSDNLGFRAKYADFANNISIGLNCNASITRYAHCTFQGSNVLNSQQGKTLQFEWIINENSDVAVLHVFTKQSM